MRDLALSAVLVALLALAAARPFVGILVWSWIGFMNPHREVWGFAQTMPWGMLSLLATGAGCFIAREPKKPALNAVTVPMLLFAAHMTLTSFTALGPSTEVWRLWERTLKILIGLQLTAAMLTDQRRIHAMIWLMVISLGFYGVKGGIFTLMTGGGFIVLGPPDSIISDRNALSVALLVVVPLMNYLRDQARDPLVRIGLVVAMVSTLMAVLGSQSRGAFIALAGSAGILWLRSNGKILSGIGIIAACVAGIMFMPDSWVERMNTIQNYQADGSAMGRIEIWRASILLAVMRPATGVGFRGMYYQHIVNMVDNRVDARSAHSIWLEVLGEHGFPGLFLWSAIIAGGLYYSFAIVRLSKDRPELKWAHDLARMSQVSIAAYALGGSFLPLQYWDLFWTLMVAVAASHALVVQQVQPGGRRSAAALAAAQRWTPQAGAAPRPASGPRPAGALRRGSP